MQNIPLALDDVNKALELDPNNKALLKLKKEIEMEDKKKVTSPIWNVKLIYNSHPHSHSKKCFLLKRQKKMAKKKKKRKKHNHKTALLHKILRKNLNSYIQQYNCDY